jgi:dUTP pyrophosphatase
MINHDPAEPIKVSRGDRIAQLVIHRFESIQWAEVDDLDDTQRGLGGWGSTG